MITDIIYYFILNILVIVCLFVVCMYGIDFDDKNVMFDIFRNNIIKFVVFAHIIICTFSYRDSLIMNIGRMCMKIIALCSLVGFYYCGCFVLNSSYFVLDVMFYGYSNQ
ncbi:MAG: hypothetical protein CMK92_05855 [Pseudomonas sp.]|nr:hypothetical protein [Pseudomonas sp.]